MTRRSPSTSASSASRWSRTATSPSRTNAGSPSAPPPGTPADATTILLARAATDHQAQYIGDQAGGRVPVPRHHDFARDHAAFTAAGVEWVRPPAIHAYGKVAVFAGLYDNRWDLVEFAASDR